jgi:soluble lytic murein transglycosylase-like protein
VWSHIVLLALGLLAASALACDAGDRIYRMVDGEGVTHISDAPNDSRFIDLSGSSGSEAGWLRVPEPSLRGGAFAREIRESAERHGVSPQLVEAVVRAESAFNPWAVSRKGARGLMQLMPQTASVLGVRDAFNPVQNIDGGVRHLRGLIDRYPGNLALAVAAYNAGAGAVDTYGGIPPFPETQQYVKKVLEHGGPPKVSAKAEPPPPEIYRYEDADGTLTFSNVPPVSGKTTR